MSRPGDDKASSLVPFVAIFATLPLVLVQFNFFLAGNRAGVVISCGLILACAGVFLGWMAHEKREGNA